LPQNLEDFVTLADLTEGWALFTPTRRDDTMVNFKKLLIIALTLMLLLAACSASEEEVSGADDEVLPFPTGTFKSMEWEWEFEDGGSHHYFDVTTPESVTNGQYTLKGDRIEIQDDMCGSGVKGAYKWEFDGDEGLLRFTTINDSCGFRSSAVGSFPWKLEE
jgi:hypothetical protein